MGLKQRVQRVLGVNELRLLGSHIEALTSEITQLRGEVGEVRARAAEVEAALRGVQDFQVETLTRMLEAHARAISTDDRLTQISADLSGVQEYQAAILPRVVDAHARAVSTDDRVAQLSGQISAEREATMASNDGVRRRVAVMSELIRDLAAPSGPSRADDRPVDEAAGVAMVVEVDDSEERNPLNSGTDHLHSDS